MPEDEGLFGDEWEQQMSRILTKSGWQRYGAGKGDFACGRCRTKSGDGARRHGIDGVYTHLPAYGDDQRPVLLEATRWSWASLSRDALQKWADKLLEKLEHSMESDDFFGRFGVPNGTFIVDALICCWVPDGSYKPVTLDGWVCQLEQRDREAPRHVWFAHNERLLWVTALLEVMEGHRNNPKQELLYFSPPRAGLSSRRQENLALEHMFSDIVFAKGRETVDVLGGTVRDNGYVFYRGRFDASTAGYLYQTMLDSNMDESATITLYRTDDDVHTRNADAEFERLWQTSNSKPVVTCRPLRATGLPRWVDE